MCGEISVTICKNRGGYKMQEIVRWDLNRLYSNEDILFPILELKEQYFVTKDVEVLSKLIQAIEKAEYYLYCRSVEESVPSDLTKLTVKVKELKMNYSK